MNEIYQEVNKKMAQTYWLTDIPNSGKIFVNVKRCIFLQKRNRMGNIGN